MEGRMIYAPVTVYGQVGCEDTERSRTFLRSRQVPFHEIDLDNDPAADAFVAFLNDGQRVTPTIMIGEQDYRVILVEPSDAQLEEVLRQTRRP